MDQSADHSAALIERTIDFEMGLVREAIAMVSGGGSRRVVVAGLHFGDELVNPARGFATAAGVRLVPLWMPDDTGADIAIERIDGD